ncbi:hypothetical protein EXIGLDRAFT_145323 [Exidia glandulosa HHB12029]|uniref:Uncharacterized protein n=1 Tax=Exidia glandulosa HHB12029 TaxID=1314781 RepID=A0A165ND62_EXIGL|nr:hypothetical protein EXIGLDRAFT_145323 [Exidia glandulosa HHB12029]
MTHIIICKITSPLPSRPPSPLLEYSPSHRSVRAAISHGPVAVIVSDDVCAFLLIHLYTRKKAYISLYPCAPI